MCLVSWKNMDLTAAEKEETEDNSPLKKCSSHISNRICWLNLKVKCVWCLEINVDLTAAEKKWRKITLSSLKKIGVHTSVVRFSSYYQLRLAIF